MSSIVKLNAVKIPRYLDCTQLSAFCDVAMHRNGFCVELKGVRVVAASGEKAGSEVEGGLVKANQRVYLPFGNLIPTRYTTLIAVHPELLAMGDVSCPRMAEPKESTPLVVRLKAFAECDPTKLPWLLRLYFLD